MVHVLFPSLGFVREVTVLPVPTVDTPTCFSEREVGAQEKEEDTGFSHTAAAALEELIQTSPLILHITATIY